MVEKANTLTGLIPTLYKSIDVVMRELTGFIPAVTLDASGEQVAKNQNLSYPIVAAQTAGDIEASATGPDPNEQTVSPGTITITKFRSTSFFWTGEEQKGLGGLYGRTLEDQFAQSMRTLINEVEADLAGLYVYASWFYGTAGSTPFDSTNKLACLAQLGKLLKDAGAPQSDLQCVIDTTAGVNLRSLTQLTNAGDAGNDSLLRRGVLLPLLGFDMRESAQVKTHTKGGGSAYAVDLTAGYAAGSTTIHVDTGAGAIKAGDIITNTKTGRDTNKYLVKTGFAGDGDGDIVLAGTGLKTAWVNNDPIAIGNSYTANLAFSRSAIHLLMRAPAMPEGGDAADDVAYITDPQTGITFQVAMYRQHRRVAYEVGLAWGVKAVKPDAMAILVG